MSVTDRIATPAARVRAGAGDRIRPGLPIRRAADARLANAVDEELQVMAAELRGDLPIEPDDPRPFDRRLHPRLAIVANRAALSRIVTEPHAITSSEAASVVPPCG
jgi:hypothetical protein